MSIDQCHIIELPKITDARGNLTFIEAEHLSFEIKRIFYLYNVPTQTSRAGHALKSSALCLIAVAGSFDIIVNDGTKEQQYSLNQPNYGLYIPPMIWIKVENFSQQANCLVLASETYNENSYYRDYQEFLNRVRGEERDQGSGISKEI